MNKVTDTGWMGRHAASIKVGRKRRKGGKEKRGKGKKENTSEVERSSILSVPPPWGGLTSKRCEGP